MDIVTRCSPTVLSMFSFPTYAFDDRFRRMKATNASGGLSHTGVKQSTRHPEAPVPNKYLRYGDQRYIITNEAEARLNRTLEAVYADGSRGHQWLNLYRDSEAPCRLLIATGVPISIETELCLDD